MEDGMVMSAKNFKSLTQIRKAREALDRREKALKAEVAADLRQKIDGMLASAGLTIEDCYPMIHRKKRKIKVKYVNPDDRSMTWTGMGHQPWWVKEHLAGGGRLDDLAV
jgi:DNA-binding protein H-NS